MSASNDTSDPTLRATGIGGSDAAAILGISSYGTPYSVAMEKALGIKEGRTEEEQERLDWGKKLEPLIAAAFEGKTGMRVDAGVAWARHREHPFIFANVDGLISEDAERWTPIVPAELRDLGPGIFEGKCAGQDDGWGTMREPQVPASYWAQAQHYMAVLDRPWTGFGALINGNRLEVRFILRDGAWLSAVWEPKLVAFWENVQTGNLPEPWNPDIDGPVLRDRYPDGAAGRRNLTDPETREVYAWQAALEEAATAKRRSEALGLRVRAIMADHSIGALTTGEQITYKLTAAGSHKAR